MSAPLLAVRDLVKEFPAPAGATRVLAGVAFDLAAGGSLAVMGPSGAGKTTLLNIIGTLDLPTAGEVLVDGAPVHTLTPDAAAAFRNRRIGFVFQDHLLLPQCTALENILLPCLAAGRPPADAVDRGRDLLAAMGLGGRRDAFPAELSGGERQRVAVARAMINRPALLLCDEPTGNLDAETGAAIARLFLDLRDRERVALLIVTHNAALAALFGRVGHLREGRLGE